MIWKKILLNTYFGNKFINAKTINPDHKHLKFQLFEVLVTETLAAMDPYIAWSSYPVQGDRGIDFIGEKLPVKSPYILNYPPQVILGQVKRRADGYSPDSFNIDIVKMVEYYKESLAPHKMIYQIIHVLSTDKNVDTSKWIENIRYIPVQFNVLPLNALDFFRFWKLNNSFFLNLIENVCTDNEKSILLAHINSLTENWNNIIETEIFVDKTAYLGEEFRITVNINSSIDLNLNIYAIWVPDPKSCSNIIIVYPNNMVGYQGKKYHIRLYKNFRLIIRMKSNLAGYHNLGDLILYSESGEEIKTISLGEIFIHKLLVSTFYDSPYGTSLVDMKNNIINRLSNRDIVFLCLLGPGGIGKSSLSKEMLYHAMNSGYYTISLNCNNDIVNFRKLIFELFIHLIIEDNSEMYMYEKTYELVQNYMGIQFNPKWANDLMKFFLNKPEVNYECIIECLITLMILSSNRKSIIIWISDMHWCSKETILLMKKIIQNIKLNMDFFNNSIIFIFEGRNNEALLLDNKTIYPYEWLDFSESSDVQKITLNNWEDKHSEEFISMLINPFHSTNDLVNNNRLKTIIKKYSGGNPMHMKEYLKSLIDHGFVIIRDNGQLDLIDQNGASKLQANSIKRLIELRIRFYHEKYTDIIDFYIILSNITTNQTFVYSYVVNLLNSSYTNYNSIEKEMGMLSYSDGEVCFTHEHYKECLQNFKIKDNKNINIVKRYYDEELMDEEEEIDCLDSIILLSLSTKPDYSQLCDILSDLVERSLSDYTKFRCSELLVNIPKKYRKNKNLSEIYFHMSEITTRISSYKNTQKYLKKIIRIQPKNDLDKLCYILACKNLGNIYAVLMDMEKSINICQTGINEIQTMIHNIDESSPLYNEFLRQYEMLLNRIGVSYWFAGQYWNSTSHQEEALRKAKDRNDTYSISHTLYETGMKMLHENIELGREHIEKALSLLPEPDVFTEKQERILVEVELLIADILILMHENQREITDLNLNQIIKRSSKICDQLKVGNVNYESSICHLVLGICYVIKDDLSLALNNFSISADCANIGDIKTVLWKSYLNIAHVYQLLYDKTKKELYINQAKHYARLSNSIILEGINTNKIMISYINMHYWPLCCIHKFLGTEPPLPPNEPYQEPIFVEWNSLKFFIMD